MFEFYSEEKEEKILVVIQAEWQRKVLSTFGECFVIDSTFNTSKYNLPLYEIVVQTNVGYIPIGIIITEDETEREILDGLTILKSWNPLWNPSSVVTDCDIAQGNALQKAFPGTVCTIRRRLKFMTF